MPRHAREEGQVIFEYALIIAGISLVLIALVIVTGLDTVFTTLVDSIEAAVS
jgi:Flp pilus assembly pilin Flp